MKTPKCLLKFTLLAATAIAGLQPVSAKIWYVGTSSQWTGKPTGDIYATPNAAFTAAAEGDEIWIAGGEYNITTRFDLIPGSAYATKLVSFYGGFAGTENSTGERQKVQNGKGWEFAHPTTLKQTGTLTSGMFYAYSGNATTATNVSIDGLTLDGNSVTTYATSGIYWIAGTAFSSLNISIKNCIVKNFGTAGTTSGAGMYLYGAQAYSSFVVDSCLIENNNGGSGGGVYIEGAKAIKNSVVRSNTGGSGGGIYVSQGTAATGAGFTISGCLIDGNSSISGNGGGGIYISNVCTKYNIHNCIVVNNTATTGTYGYGGGIYFGSGGTGDVIAGISNLTVANNQGKQNGGGVYFGKAGIGVYNSIFYNNKLSGGSVANLYASSSNSPAAFNNNIIDQAYSNITQKNCVTTSDSAAIFGENWVTLPTSPGVDNGTINVGDLVLPTIDYAGKIRIQDGAIDIGPYEREGSVDNTPPTAPANLALKSASKTTLTLEWDKSTDEVALKGYAISVNNGAPTTVMLADLDTSYLANSKVCYLLTGLTGNTQYEVSVKALDLSDNVSGAATGTFSTTNADDPKVLWYVGNSWQGKPFNRIKATPNDAFTAAAEGDEIWIAEGEYNITIRFDLIPGSGSATKLVSFYGGFVGTENSTGERQKVQNGKGWEFAHPTILKQTGALSYGMFYAYSGNATTATNISIDGLTLDGNSATTYTTSGIYWIGGTAFSSLNVSIKNCIVKNFGTAGTTDGAGMRLTGTAAYGSFVVDSCLIEDNKGNNGGGVNVEGPKVIKNSTIRSNTASTNGGGIYAYTGTAAAGAGLTITGCLIDGNTAASNGGGIFVRDVAAKHNIHNCIVVNNTATTGYGGGIYFSNSGTGDVIAGISNLTVANNQGTSYGGGVYFAKAGIEVYNSIFYNNKLPNGSVANLYALNTNSPAAFGNNIIDKAYSNITQTNCVETSDSAAIFGENWVTLLTSPGTDKGTANVGDKIALPDVDYTGKTRQVGVIDIGPYETYPVPANFTGSPGSNLVVLSWGAMGDATTRYKVYADAGSLEEATTLVATIPTPYYVATGLTPESQYTFTVRAAIEPAGSATVRVTTLDAGTPESPSGLASTAVTDTSASLSWTLPVATMSKYIIYANGVAVDSTADGTGTSATVRGLLPWREYAFTVRSKSESGALSASTIPVVVHTTDNVAPSAPTATLKSATKTTLTVEWSASVDAGVVASYTVYVNGNSVTSIAPTDVDADIFHLMNDKFAYTITGLVANTKYSVGVKAYDEAGNPSELNADSLSTNDADEPLIWYVGKWTGKPANRVRSNVNTTYTEVADISGAQLWIQGEYDLSGQIILSGRAVNGISFYGGFAGYESDPSERVRIPGGKKWEFAYPTTLRRSAGTATNIIYSGSSKPPQGNITIDGLTLESANVGNTQGIYWNLDSVAIARIAIRSCVIQNFGSDSSTSSGGGMYIGGSVRHESFVVEDCLIRNNKAYNGGGIYMTGYKTIRNCEILNNSVIGRQTSTAPEDDTVSVGAGGGIYVYSANGASSVTGCLIEGNSAYSGGGVYLHHVSDSAAVSNNVVVNNTAVFGGGVAFSGDTSALTTSAKISNFTIASNYAAQRGGGVYLTDSGQQVYNAILWNNRAGAENTVNNVYVSLLASSLTFSHNIVDRDYGYANLAQVSCATEADSAKLFGAGWVTLFPSVAEDGGSVSSQLATSVPATDILGNPRVVGGGIDIGPYERQAESGAPSVPQNLEGAPEGTGDIVLTWQPSTPAGDDAVAGYLIYLNRELRDTVFAPDTTCTVTELALGDYIIQVAAFSNAGKVSPKTPLDNVITLIEGDYYTVKITSAGEGITLTSNLHAPSTNTVPAGDSLVITFTLADEYELPAVVADGNTVSIVLTDTGYVAVIKSTFNVKGVSISARLKPVVTISADQNVIVILSPVGNRHVVSTGSEFVITFNPKESGATPAVTANGVAVTPEFSGGVYRVTITVTEDVTVNLSATSTPTTGVEDVWDNDFVVSSIYYNILGQEIREPSVSGVYVVIVKETYESGKVLVRKRLIIIK